MFEAVFPLNHFIIFSFALFLSFGFTFSFLSKLYFTGNSFLLTMLIFAYLFYLKKNFKSCKKMQNCFVPNKNTTKYFAFEFDR